MPLNSDRRNLLFTLGEGVLVPRRWLAKFRLDKHAIDNLVKSGQLFVVSKGIYMRRPAIMTTQSIIYSLQVMFKLDVVVGGLTALEMQGYGHYVTKSDEMEIHLYAGQKLPNWLNKKTGFTFNLHTNTELLGGAGKQLNNSFSLEPYRVPYQWREEMSPIYLSSPERALLEVLAGVPTWISFEHAYELMQGMTALSPTKMQKLLENCNNIKIKRLFFWLADRLNYSWLTKIDRNNIDLGAGKRMLLKGGKFDKKYNITVPESL